MKELNIKFVIITRPVTHVYHPGLGLLTSSPIVGDQRHVISRESSRINGT